MLAPDVDTHSDNAKRDDAGDGDDDADDDNEVTAISRLGPPLKKYALYALQLQTPSAHYTHSLLFTF